MHESPAVGVQLLGVRDDDKAVGVFAQSGTVKVNLLLESGRTKEISSADIVSGHRGLKGNKVISREQIKRVEPVRPTAAKQGRLEGM